MGTRQTFSPEFKREAVQVLESGSRPASQTPRELGIRRNQLYKWQTQWQSREIGGPESLLRHYEVNSSSKCNLFSGNP